MGGAMPRRGTLTPPLPADRNAPVPPTFADVYDAVVGRDFWSHWWRAFERLEKVHGLTYRSVCDVACGTAEIARRFALRGLDVTGVDLSEDMIRVARAKCLGTTVELRVQAMERLAVARPVDLIVCCYDSLNRLASPELMETTLGRFATALAPGGHVVCDLATRRHLERDWGTGVVRAVTGGIESVWQTVWHPDRGCLDVHVTAFVPGPDGRPVPVTERAREYAHAKDAVEAAVARVGLRVLDVRDMLPWEPGSEAGERLFYLLEAPA
jgi:predicted TPR repeat methyltransferase